MRDLGSWEQQHYGVWTPSPFALTIMVKLVKYRCYFAASSTAALLLTLTEPFVDFMPTALDSLTE